MARTSTVAPRAATTNHSSPQSAKCPTPGCNESLEFTPDAIGRLRERCPVCDGINRRPSSMAPSLRATPQPLPDVDLVGPARVPRPASTDSAPLPAIAAGQLRCQVCACGVDPKRRFCVPCELARKAAARRRCARCDQPVRGKAELCRTHRKAARIAARAEVKAGRAAAREKLRVEKKAARAAARAAKRPVTYCLRCDEPVTRIPGRGGPAPKIHDACKKKWERAIARKRRKVA